MASSLTTTNSIESLNSKGYLTSFKIESNLNPDGNFYFCSENMIGLKIEDIRMFTLLTGKNGIGKSKILKLIRYRLNKNINTIKIVCDKKMESKLIHFDTNLIDLRGQFFIEEITVKPQLNTVKPKLITVNTRKHSEVNFFEQTNKGRNYDSTFTNFCDIRDILKTRIQNENQLTAFNKVLENASFFNFSYDMSSCYLVLSRQKENKRNKRNLLDITPEDFNRICFKFENFDYSFEEFSGFVTKEQMNTIQQYPLNNHKIEDALVKGEIKIIEEFVFKNKKTGMKIPLSFMTSGEHVLLLVLLLRLQDTQNKKILLMLDEPDAFLNPSCVNDFLEGLFYLVNEKQIQIIMITHNSTTVGLVARKMKFVNDKNTIILVKEEKGKIIAKQQNDNFTEVFTELNSDLICVDLPYKIVFVEGIDSRMYSLYYKHTPISKNVQLIFRPSGNEDQSNRDKVIETVRRTTMPSKRPSKRPSKSHSTQLSTQPLIQDETKLSNLIFGIVDKDYYCDKVNRDLKEEINNIYVLERYCKENYLFDPIHIYFSFLDYSNELDKEKEKLEVKKVKGKLNNFFELKDDPLMKNLKNINDILKLDNSNQIFQKIIDKFHDQIKEELKVEIKGEITKVNKKIEDYKTEIKKIDEEKIPNIDAQISNLNAAKKQRQQQLKKLKQKQQQQQQQQRQQLETEIENIDNQLEPLNIQKQNQEKEKINKTKIKELQSRKKIILEEIYKNNEFKIKCKYNDSEKTIYYPRALYDLSGKDLLGPFYRNLIFLNGEPNLTEDFILDKMNSIGIFIPDDIKDIFVNISKLN